MQIVIDIDENVFTRLFDNGTEDYEIVNDDLFAIAKSIRKGTPLEKHDEEVIKETVESIWGKPPYTEALNKIRAEIESMNFDFGDYYDHTDEIIEMVCKVLDKYKAESGGTGMNLDGMYYKVTQEYLHLNRDKRELMKERDKINAQLEVIEGILIDLNDILCKHGNHVYEHFEESEEQA